MQKGQTFVVTAGGMATCSRRSNGKPLRERRFNSQ